VTERRWGQPVAPIETVPPPIPPPPIPNDLINAVADGTAVLFLGAGASMSAGLPSAAAFVDAMVQRLHGVDTEYVAASSGTLFNSVATDFESVLGPPALWDLAQGLVDPPFLAGGTPVHGVAARLFDTVVTTNYDTLLERALVLEGRVVDIIDGELSPRSVSAPVQVIKLHGSISNPPGLVLTEADLANLETTRPKLWSALRALLSGRPVLCVGSSLRDPSLIRLFEACRPGIHGWAMLREISGVEERRLARWGLRHIDGDADVLLARLEAEVARRRQL
jgi:hypothetical protein